MAKANDARRIASGLSQIGASTSQWLGHEHNHEITLTFFNHHRRHFLPTNFISSWCQHHRWLQRPGHHHSYFYPANSPHQTLLKLISPPHQLTYRQCFPLADKRSPPYLSVLALPLLHDQKLHLHPPRASVYPHHSSLKLFLGYRHHFLLFPNHPLFPALVNPLTV